METRDLDLFSWLEITTYERHKHMPLHILDYSCCHIFILMPNQWVMTPINFVTFLVSLYLVDWHFRSKREHIHDDGRQSSWPAWLHHLVFHPEPYSWAGRGTAPPNKGDRNFYYHTKQKKLMKMEASVAFEMRRRVLLGLMAVGLGLIWALTKLLVKIVARCM